MKMIFTPRQAEGDSVRLTLGVLLRALPVVRKYGRGSMRFVPLLCAAWLRVGTIPLHALFVSRV